MGALIGLPLFPFSGSIFENHPPFFAELRSVQKRSKTAFLKKHKGHFTPPYSLLSSLPSCQTLTQLLAIGRWQNYIYFKEKKKRR